jgi:hypothetical protein
VLAQRQLAPAERCDHEAGEDEALAVAALQRAPDDQDDPEEDHELGQREAAPGSARPLVERRPPRPRLARAGRTAGGLRERALAGALRARRVALRARRLTALAASPAHSGG